MTDPTLTWSGTDVELVLALGPDSLLGCDPNPTEGSPCRRRR